VTTREYDQLLAGGPRMFGVAAVPLVALVAANLVPLFGVLLLEWDLRGVLLLYWSENVIVALWAIARMLVVGKLAAIPLIVFFCFHFGIFVFVHLIFVFVLTDAGPWSGGEMQQETRDLGAGFFPAAGFLEHVSWPALAALFISHGVSFVRNFMLGGEWLRTTAAVEMGRPYPRMAIMHIAIIAGAFAIAVLGAPAALLAVLVLLKIAVDAASHVAEHRGAARAAARPAATE
jgi:hypothetical protein